MNFPYFESGFCCLCFRENDLVTVFCFFTFVTVTGMFLPGFMFMIVSLMFVIMSLVFMIMSFVAMVMSFMVVSCVSLPLRSECVYLVMFGFCTPIRRSLIL